MKSATKLLALSTFVLSFAFTGCSQKQSHMFSSLKDPATTAQLKQFVSEKAAQADAAAKADGQELLPEYKTLFAAAAKGNWWTIQSTFRQLSQRAPQYAHDGTNDERLTGIQWGAVLDTYGAFEAFAGGGDKYCLAFGRDIIKSIPPGSIYFGGTDPGRFLVTALQKSHGDGDPFFTLTQNALADGGYLAYLRSMYGDKIYVPTDEDLGKCFQDYIVDATQRLRTHQLKPGENVMPDANGKMQVRGQVSVMEINGLLAKTIFDKNPDRELFIEVSFPLDWMYPYLEPHGLIMEINRQPPAELSDDIVSQDRDCWTKYLTPMIGGWLNDDTPVSDVTAFVEKVYVRHDFSGFAGDPRFVQNDYACRMFSKLRGSIAGIYVWRLNHAASEAEKQRMAHAADFAFRQALALCPYNPEIVRAYTGFLNKQNRGSDAVLVGKIGRGGTIRRH
ncbi:MAG TPA: hypothetical protein VED19_02030 [Candidatus Nitrosopolaris sp.]|nr:hypothetical protein [Candidatus Nitrosopolaris sp.]